MRRRAHKGLGLAVLSVILAQPALAGAVSDWVIAPTAGYDEVKVALPGGASAGYAALGRLSSNYYAGLLDDVRFATAVVFRNAQGEIVRCAVDTQLPHGRNALIIDNFTQTARLVCGRDTAEVKLKAGFQFQVARTLFLEVSMQPLQPTSGIPAIISYKVTLKHPGDTAPATPTMTVLDLNDAAANRFPVVEQRSFAPIEIDPATLPQR